MTDRNLTRDAEIWHLYAFGHSQPKIAERFGLSQARISQILADFRRQADTVDKSEVVRQSMAQLDWVTQELRELAAAEPMPAYSNGRPILTGKLTSDGEPEVAPDHSTRLTAMRELRATNESRRKLLGADAKLETSLTVDTTDEVAALLARARTAREAEDRQREQDEG